MMPSAPSPSMAAASHGAAGWAERLAHLPRETRDTLFQLLVIGWADRRQDPAGVMLDDLLAGIAAGLAVIVAAGLAHGVMALT